MQKMDEKEDDAHDEKARKGANAFNARLLTRRAEEAGIDVEVFNAGGSLY